MPAARRRSPTRSRSAALVVLALLAGCGSTAQLADNALPSGSLGGPGSDTTARGATDPTGQDPGAGALTGSAPSGAQVTGIGGAGAPGMSSTAPVSPGRSVGSSTGLRLDRQGVTPTTIKIGFLGAANVEAFREAMGGGGPAYGDSTDQANALVDYVNKHGGIAGRRIVPVIHNVDVAGTASGADHESVCTAFTEDDHVFAVLSLSNGPDGTPACYARHRTLFITSVMFGFDASQYQKFSPYYWSASGDDLTNQAKLMANALADKGFYRGHKVGLLYADSPSFNKVVKETLLPELKRRGVVPTRTQAIRPYSYENLGAIQAETGSAALAFKTDGIDRVIMLDMLGTIALFFIPNAVSQNYYPVYGLVSGNQPEAVAESSAGDEMVGTIGAGYSPVADTHESKLPFPSSAGEKRCMDIMRANGITFERRIDAIFALEMCDNIFFLQAAARGLGDVSIQSFAAAAEGLAGGFPSAMTHATGFGPGRRTGAQRWRYFAYDPACRCLGYEKQLFPLRR